MDHTIFQNLIWLSLGSIAFYLSTHLIQLLNLHKQYNHNENMHLTKALVITITLAHFQTTQK